MTTPITPADIQRIWAANGLGRIERIEPVKRGLNNRATVVDDAYVIRFDVLDLKGVCRYVGEQLAYERLRAVGLPAPEVVALDLSKTLIPYHYMILTKVDGRPLIDDWQDFSPAQQAKIGQTAGRYLAQMHAITLDGFGKLSRLATTPLPRWYDHVAEFFERYAGPLTEQGVLDNATYTRMCASVERLRPAFDMTSSGRLIHADYQFENLLHVDGRITAILDFEWSLAGDPAWDFRLDDQWEDDCPGSAAHLYAGYTATRPLADDHRLRVWLYKLLFHLDDLDMYADEPGQEATFGFAHREALRALAALERLA
jgi:aminoglycoside phosphotransferase (APT) family kinase protein